MINANELRRGNVITYIKNNKKKQVVVSGIATTMIACKECAAGFEHFEPIPINEDWLLKRGFVKNIYDSTVCSLDWFDLAYGYGYNAVEQNWYFAMDFENGNGYSCLYQPLKHVHQLQNLYFALTGEELKIKE